MTGLDGHYNAWHGTAKPPPDRLQSPGWSRTGYAEDHC